MSQRIESEQAANFKIEEALKQLRKETADVDALRGGMAVLLARKQVAEVLSEGSSPAAEAFAELSRLPADIVLSVAHANEMHLSATGIAGSDAAAQAMLKQLGTMHFITNPRLAKIDPAAGSNPFGTEARVFQLEADLRH